MLVAAFLIIQVMSDDEKRQLYDLYGEAGDKGGPGAGAGGAYAVSFLSSCRPHLPRGPARFLRPLTCPLHVHAAVQSSSTPWIEGTPMGKALRRGPTVHTRT